MDTKELGNLGEKLACEYLVKKGYKILEKNCVLFCGEIDIIARKKCGLFIKDSRAIHFVEVKTLTNPGCDFFPEQKVDWKKQNKYKKLAEVWLEKNKYPQNYPCQVDIVAVLANNGANKIDFFENVISAI